MQKLLLATSNAGKIKEFQAILHFYDCLSQKEFNIVSPAETGLSFIENAILKARHASLHSNMAALADDSGLVVPALNDLPGIYSARFAGPNASNHENMQLLLTKIQDLPNEKLTAYFYCALALLRKADDPMPIIAIGKIPGTIVKVMVGNNGFGYDPIFYLDEYRCTMAELPLNIKNKISHRAQALQQLIAQIKGDL